jgi:GNAT superfamily N-acetyltransferase
MRNPIERIAVRAAQPRTSDVDALAAVLVDCVNGGASVGFMRPITAQRAAQFWAETLGSAARGERIVLVAEANGLGVVGTVQVILAPAENQPHRADVAKMLVRRDARRRGIGEALMRAAEAHARDADRTLLVLDTASADAERMYDRLGWQRVGVIPDYALWPDGGFVNTTIFYKNLTS